jgi:ribosomal protein L16 Arg81 hydroxylase
MSAVSPESLETGPVHEWLAGVALADFRRAYLGKQPFARPGSACSTIACCTWEILDALLQARPPDVLTVGSGRQLSEAAPKSLSELPQLFARQVGLAIRAPEHHSPPLAELSRGFAQSIPGVQRVIVFVTPAQSHGFGWHYDAEDVFIVQTAGDKEYFFRRNTVSPGAPSGDGREFNRYACETSPVMSARLWPGDFLYLPRGFWHVAHAHQHSLSISIGVFPRTV